MRRGCWQVMSSQSQTVALKRDQSAIAMVFLLAALAPVAWWIADHTAYPKLSYSEAVPIATLGTSALLSSIGVVIKPRRPFGVALCAAIISFCAVSMCAASTRQIVAPNGYLPPVMAAFGALCGPLFV